MVRLRYLNQTCIRALLSPLNNETFYYSTIAASAITNTVHLNPIFTSYSTPVQKLHAEDVVVTFQEWFKSTNRNPFIERILEILSSNGNIDRSMTGDDVNFVSQPEAVDMALSRLNLRLTEELVLDVLFYGKDVLSCLKFFDWAGRQPGFHHTRATFNAIFKILSRAKLFSLMLDYLDNYAKHRGGHKSNFHNILVMGYAVAGKPEIALQLFGRMRYKGIDLDDFAYHVLLNALVEENYFDGVDSVATQIKNRGFESEVTHSILVKGFCKKKEFDRAEKYLRGVMDNGVVKLKSGQHIVGALVDGLCKDDQFDKAGKLVDEFGEFHVYDVWFRELVRARKLDGAMEFLHKTRDPESVVHYVPDVFRYNTLILRLLRDNKLEDVCDLIIEMKESNVPPDELTMNIVLCFFCKAGMVDVALRLYDMRGEIGLSLSSMGCNYLMNTLCGDGSVVDAYRILKNTLEQGYFPGKMTFSILADALCKLNKLDMMKELFLVAIDNNIVLDDRIHENYIKALCKTGRVEEGYFVHEEINRFNKVTTGCAYHSLIHGFIKLNRGDIASKLLIEMQEKGHTPSQPLTLSVIQSVCEMENFENYFQRLLEKQLSIHELLDCKQFNVFIEGAGLANKPELAKEVYHMMKRSGVSPNVRSDILLLKSYLKGLKVSDALHFYEEILTTRKIGRKICNTLVIGLCKAKKPDLALEYFLDIRKKQKSVRPSLECYEELIYMLCQEKRYSKIVDLIDDLLAVGRPISSFIGNNLLLCSLKDRELYDKWVESRPTDDESSRIFRLGEVVGLFSGRFREEDIEWNDLEQVVRSCFPLDVYTYNMLLRKLLRSSKRLNDACKLFDKMCRKGYEPNQWTYETFVHGYYHNGMKEEGDWWIQEMLRRGFKPSEATNRLTDPDHNKRP
ncbi:pentatricopeptide repeat-containing protein At1g71210, mitochondrial [Rutidosis leptorrhynchoides]|uniref:pentatricopeptide repeat-containing protein At1g71210, mitochondrial n=1 Tax=Rutidosis leptorrhynchoides TaxID=125765 RepID=UPI003A9A06B2